MIKKILEKKNVSIYRCAKDCKIPYSTLRDLVSDRSSIENVTSSVLVKLARYLDIDSNSLYEICLIRKRDEFDIFKSEMCHLLHRMQVQNFVRYMLEKNLVEVYWSLEWYPESLYCLAMLDQLFTDNHVELYGKYNRYRTAKLEKPVFPKDALIEQELFPDEKILDEYLKTANPEFLKYNIVEGDIYDQY